MSRIRSALRRTFLFLAVIAACAVFAAPAFALTPPPPGSPAPARPEIWRYTLDNPPIETIMVDVDGNGHRDFITIDNGKLYLRLETGYPIWKQRNAELDAARVTAVLTVANLDAQGAAEIITTAGDDLWVIDGATMATLAHLPQTRLLGLTDLDGNGAAEVYLAPRQAKDPEYPPIEVAALAGGKWTKLYSHPGVKLMTKPTQDAYQPGEKAERFYILDLDDDGKPREVLAALPAGKGWIGLGYNESANFAQVWEFTEIQDGTSRLQFLDWTDGNYDTYYDILAYQYDTRRVFNSDVVSMGDSIGSFPLRHIDEPPSSAKALKVDRVKPGEWPMRHRDARWTGRSPLKMAMTQAPTAAWSYAYGANPTGLTLAELDGKPGADLLVSARGRFIAYASEGQILWQSEYLGAPRLEGFYDLDGDGKNEMLVAYRKVNSEPAHAVLEPATGKQLWEFKTPPYLGGGTRLQIGKYLPKNKGLQVFGWGAYGFYADLTFFDFSDGYEKAAKPVWVQHPEHVIYPTEDVYDYDSDGDLEYVLLEHSRLRIFDIATGKIERDFEWGKYRSYGSMTPVKFGDDPYWKLLVTSWNSMLVVEMIDINETSGSLMWKIPGKIGFRTTNAADAYRLGRENRIGDIDGDGQTEVAYLKLNESGDRKWHAYIRDLKTGKLKKDTPLKAESFEEAGITGFKELPGKPTRPVMVQPAPAPAGSVRIVDAATGKLELLDPAGKATASLAVPETVTGMIYNPLVADLNGDGKPEVIIPKTPNNNPRTYKADLLILQPAAQSGQAPSLLREEKQQELMLIFDRLQNGKNERLYLEPDPQGCRLVLKDSADKTVWTSVIAGDPEILQQVTCGDFNGDGTLDVFCNFYHVEMSQPTGKKIFTINGEYVRRGVWNGKNGELLWHACNVMGGERPFDYASHPTVYDANGDGKDDILSLCPDVLTVASGDTGKLIYEPHFSKSFWNHAGALYNIPFAEDLDGDGKTEIYGQRACAGTCVMRLPNEPMWANGQEDQGMYSLISDSDFQGVADVDGDGKMEIGIGLRKGEFRCYAAEDGRVQWSFRPGSPTSEVCSADVDGDGKYEFLFGTEEGWLYAVGGGDKAENPVKWKLNLNAPVGAPIVADVDGDGQGEILVCTGDGRLHCLAAAKELAKKQ